MIAVLVAMRAEARGVIAELGFQSSARPAGLSSMPFEFYRGRVGQEEVVLTLNGKDPRSGVDNIGLEPAALAAFATVQEFRPRVLISVGTCGSFARLGSEVGTVYLSSGDFVFHDRRIPLAGFEGLARGGFPSLDVSDLARRLHLPLGAVSSGSSLDYTEAELERFFASGAKAKEMEATAIAWVCSWSRTPFFAVKSVTNLIDVNGDSASEFAKNFDVAAAALTSSLSAVLRAIGEEGVDAWLARAPRSLTLSAS